MAAVIWISIVSLQVRFCYYDIVNFRHIRRFLKISLTPGQIPRFVYSLPDAFFF